MIYTIHGNADQQRSEDLVAVPESLAPWALVAPPIWLIMHRLWWPLTFYVLFVVFTMTVSATSFAVISMVLSWLPGVYLLLEGRELYRKKLQDSGLEMIGIVNADDEEEAIMRHVMREKLDISPSASLEAMNEQKTMVRTSSNRQSAASNGIFGLFSPEES